MKPYGGTYDENDMAYQALLFCPDEKTARTVTQVLGELDFQVHASTEPFAAVKKLMAERFDAVVVDCDNEQNATLLFKSARNAPNNASALAVAVVEGQAGVAKAFRIGANLVLTKPINVEQSKGTLRVARGLLRKNESAKTTPLTAGPTKPGSASAETAKGPLPPVVSAARPYFTVPPPVPSPPAAKPGPPAMAEASGFEAGSDDEILSVAPEPEVVAPAPSPAAARAVPLIESPVEAKSEAAASNVHPGAHSVANLSGRAQGGAASAPAPALEPKAADPAANVKTERETSKERVANKAKDESEDLVSEKVTDAGMPAPTFGIAEKEPKPSGGGKKAVLAAAAVVLIAVAGYWAWTQFGSPRPTPASSVQPVQRPFSPSSAVLPPVTPAAATLPSASSATPAPSSSLPGNTDADSHSNAVTKTHVSSSVPTKESKESQARADSSSNSKAGSAKSSDETAESVRPIMVKSGTGPAKPPADAPAPEIAGIPTAQDGAGLPNLVNSSAEPAPVLAAMSVSQGVSQGLIIKKVSPSYPANALRLRIEGQVELLATVSKKGDISAIKVLSGDPNLTRAAVDAVRQWKYKPYLLDGAPVEIQTQVTVNFKLPR
jgi:TonB family protein